MPLDCFFPMNFFGKLLLRTLLPLIVYPAMLVAAAAFRRFNKPWQSDALIDGVFFIMFLIYPSTAAKLFSVFICESLEDGSGRMRVDFSIACSDTAGQFTGAYVGMLIFTVVMIVVHVIGTPAIYTYLFFVKYREPLEALQAQELSDWYVNKLTENAHLTEQEKEQLKTIGTAERIKAEKLLPGYMRKLTKGYEYRTYWFEIFETVRKVLLVGLPACFPDRGGNTQLVWGLMVCFFTFGAYMMFAPFVEDSDDQLQQLAQFQIFLTLVASIGLRMSPPNETLSTLMSILIVCIPIIAVLLETPLVAELRGGVKMLRSVASKLSVRSSASRAAVVPAVEADISGAMEPVEHMAVQEVEHEDENPRGEGGDGDVAGNAAPPPAGGGASAQ